MSPDQHTRIRPMGDADRWAVADLIYVSTNFWYQTKGKPPIFTGGPESTMLFCDVYEDLDPGCCLVTEDTRTGQLMGSCFYHPRSTHVSLGIMNAHPNYAGRGVARGLLEWINNFTDERGLPLRLVSSAVNLDSFSLYTHHGFIPRQPFQDMLFQVPEKGLNRPLELDGETRPATMDDVEAMVALEMEVAGINREKDFRYFIENKRGIWHVSVLETSRGLEGFLVSVAHPGSNMLGPGVMREDTHALALIQAELNANKGRCPVFLVPVDSPKIVHTLYEWGARNCEIHFCQVRGEYQPFKGIVMPTFMPETG